MSSLFFFNDTATTEIYTLSLHDALPIYARRWWSPTCRATARPATPATSAGRRSEEHTSELQSHSDLVCRLLLEKKKGVQLRRSPTLLHKRVTERTVRRLLARRSGAERML